MLLPTLLLAILALLFDAVLARTPWVLDVTRVGGDILRIEMAINEGEPITNACDMAESEFKKRFTLREIALPEGGYSILGTNGIENMAAVLVYVAGSAKPIAYPRYKMAVHHYVNGGFTICILEHSAPIEGEKCVVS